MIKIKINPNRVLSTIIISLGLLFYSNVWASHYHESDLETHTGEGAKSITLPFPYIHLDLAVEKPAFVHERGYTVLDDRSVARALVGPLKPCVFVGLRNDRTGRSVVFHKHYSNSLDELISVAKAELGDCGPSEIRGLIFSNRMRDYDKVEETDVGKISFRTQHGGKTQAHELVTIKMAIKRAFNIDTDTDTRQIKMQFFTPQHTEQELGNYQFADVSVLVDSKLNIFSTCYMGENYFDDFSHLAIEEKKRLVKAKQVEAINQFTLSFLKWAQVNKNMDCLTTYNCMPFKRVN